MNEIAQRTAGLPANYDPDKGLKKLAVAEAAEQYFARAKDSTGLHKAVEAKLGEQRRFVLWWDQQKHGGEAKAGHPMSETADIRIENFGLDRDTVHRWRKRLKDPGKFDHTLEAAHARCVGVQPWPER